MRNYSPYELDGKPRLLDAIPLGLQHVLAMFVSNITPVIIVLGVLNVPLETIGIDPVNCGFAVPLLSK